MFFIIGLFFLVVKWLEREADHSSPSRNIWREPSVQYFPTNEDDALCFKVQQDLQLTKQPDDTQQTLCPPDPNLLINPHMALPFAPTPI
jgi:hypothetical protein